MTVEVQNPIVEYTANGTTADYVFGYRIILEEELFVYFDGVLETTGYTVENFGNNGGTVVFATPPTAGVLVRLERELLLKRDTDYQTAGELKQETLDNDIDRPWMAIQDIKRRVLLETPDSTFDAGGRIISNAGEPVSPQDVITKNWAETVGIGFAGDAAASADAALVSEGNALTSENNAEDWATDTTGLVEATDNSSKAYAIGGTGVTDTAGKGAAKEWATKGEDLTVDGTDFSSKHYSIKSAASAASIVGDAAAAAASAAAALVSEGNAATSETNSAGSATASAGSAGAALTSEGNALTSEGNADTSEAAALVSADNAATSAAAAASAANSLIWNDVVFKSFADSPITLAEADRGVLYAIDTSGGNVVINLPTVAGVTMPYTVGVKKSTGDANNVTINRSGTDTINSGLVSLATDILDGGWTFVGDADPAPDVWVAMAFGPASSAVTSVAGKVGDVVLVPTDAGAVDITGDTMTGNLIIATTADSTPLLRIEPKDDLGNPGINILDSGGANRFQVFWHGISENIYLRRKDASSATQTDFILTSNGNVSVNGVTPSADNHLTRKDYVDATTVSLAGDTMTGNLTIDVNDAKLTLNDNNGTADSRRWDVIAAGDSFILKTVNDAETFSAEVLRVERTGSTVDSVDIKTVVTGTEAPTAIDHLTRKDYVDANFVKNTVTATVNFNNNDIDNAKTITFNSELAVSGTAVNWTLGQKLSFTVTTAITPVFTAPTGPCNLTLKVINGGTGTITWPATVKWPSGTEPAWTTAGTDIASFYFDGTNYYGMAGLAFA